MTPGDTQRQGPRPLPLHLTGAMTIWLSSLAGLPRLSGPSPDPAMGSLGRDPALVAAARALTEGPAATPPPSPRPPPADRPASRPGPSGPGPNQTGPSRAGAQAQPPPGAGAADRDPNRPTVPPAALEALDREIRRRADRLLTGIVAYRTAADRRDRSDGTIVWQRGSTRLRDFGPADGKPVLFVPSLVNRWTILDLDDGASLLEAAADRGLRPLVIDWDRPGAAEAGFDLDAYLTDRLVPALTEACAVTGRGKLPVVGYCMGGTMAVALAALAPAAVAGLALLAAPWDFHADPIQARQGQALATALGPMLDALPDDGVLPLDALQMLFTATDPLLVAAKFDRFAGLTPGDPRRRAFILLEDWLNDGVPLTAPVARETLTGWYGENRLAAGAWRVAGRTIDPAALTLPSLHMIPSADRIVPPASALNLAAAMAGARILRPPLGHIGMVTSRSAPRHAWRPLLAWLARVPIGRKRSTAHGGSPRGGGR